MCGKSAAGAVCRRENRNQRLFFAPVKTHGHVTMESVSPYFCQIAEIRKVEPSTADFERGSEQPRVRVHASCCNDDVRVEADKYLLQISIVRKAMAFEFCCLGRVNSDC